MRAIKPQVKASRDGLHLFSTIGTMLCVLVLISGLAFVAQGQQKELPRIAKPPKIFTVQGRVSLPDGTPAGRALVTLINSNGIPRQAYTTEQGRYEFPGMEEGNYTLTAQSLDDPQLMSERVEAETEQSATGSLMVNLTMRREPGATAGRTSPAPAEVVNVAEAGQRVPKEARRAFKEGVRFRSNNEPEKALASFTQAIALYPEYFQALTARGDLQVLQRKLPEAEADFAAALKVNPRYGPALRGAGYCKLERREFAAAVQDFEKSLTAQPDNANTYLLLGIAYLELDQRDAAKAALVKALGFNTPHEQRAYIHLANLYAREHLYREAAEELHKYLEANPADPDAARLKAVEAMWRARAEGQ